jgi:uncharacterized protein with HEPN domain
MPQHDDLVSLNHMLTHSREVVELIGTKSFEEFMQDRLTQLATARLLEIVGEAANRVAVEKRHQLPQIPWRNIIDFRNIIVHAYDTIEYEIVWKAVHDDLPILIEHLEDVLEPEQ